MDVDNKADYKEMVGKLCHDKSRTIKILVDMKQVERLPSSESRDETSDPSDGDDNLKSSSHSAADLDTHLAQWWIKLQQLHKNEQNKGFTYVGPMGPILLTPAMILDWCHALEDGEATLRSPPNLESFNMANKVTYLHPMRKVQALAQPPPPTMLPLDVNALTSVLLLQMLTKSGLLPSSVPTTPSGQSILSLVTPPRANAEHSPSSPLVPLPTQLSCFLHFAEVNLGICNATKYEVDLNLQGISPDILAEVDDKVLSDVGISVSNIIHLKRGCVVWWNSSDAKRKWSNTEASTNSTEPPRPAHKKVLYKKHFFTGGGNNFSGPPMTPDDNLDNSFSVPADYNLFYKCDVQGQWLPVPKGYVVDKSGEDLANDLDPFYTT
ncbi:hypothetical protein EDC04DRAFT_2895240 [Pisolithus marmoratus]|nr:hypothetical protein EDC04DRAFT_2895240 [Pisolithus marmoratus]